MKKKQEPRKDSFLTGTNSVNGIRKNQRPELWNLFNGRKRIGEHFRVFPLSNWTEMDIWQYILHEKIEMPSLYFSHDRECFIRDEVIDGEM